MSKIKFEPYEIRKMLMFILSMQKTGASITSSLSYYGEKVVKNQSFKNALSDVVSQMSGGGKLEDVLRANGFLNDFQYAILKISKNKQSAIESIINLNENKNDALTFYFKQFSNVMLVFSGILFLLPYATDFFFDIMMQINKTKTEAISGTIGWMLKNDDILQPIGVFVFILYLLGMFFYYYTYKNNVALHYKVFKYSAMIDNRTLFGLINDLLKTELTAILSLGLLAKHYEPKSTRTHLLKLKDFLENRNIEGAEMELVNLGVNDFARFSIVSALKIGDTKRGFINALVNIEDYNKVEIENYRTNVDFIVFMLTSTAISLTLLYVIILETKMGML
jgi:hypothetical protein